MRPTLRDLLVLAWPVIISRSTQTVMGIADAVMVSHLGANALAATTAGANNSFLVLILPLGTVFIVQSFAAQLFGKGDVVGARRFAVYGLLVALVAQLAAFAALPLVGPFYSLLPYEPDVVPGITRFTAIRLLATGPAIGIEAMGAYYGGIGRTRVPMVANVVAMVVNVPLNAVFINGFGPVPAMGTDGAAIASSLGTTLAFVGLFAYFRSQGALPRPRREELLRTLRFGVPSGFNWFFEFLAFAVFVNLIVAGMGTNALGALMAVMQINAASFMPAFGMASAGAILVGQAIGQEDRDDVPRILRMTFFTAAAWQGVVGLGYLTVPELLFSPFAREAGSRAALLAVGVEMLRWSAGWQLFDSAANTIAESLRAAGDTLWPLVARLLIAWLVFLPGSYLAVTYFEGGPGAAIVWLIAYIGLLALVLFLRFRSGAWRKLALTEPQLD